MVSTIRWRRPRGAWAELLPYLDPVPTVVESRRAGASKGEHLKIAPHNEATNSTCGAATGSMGHVRHFASVPLVVNFLRPDLPCHSL